MGLAILDSLADTVDRVAEVFARQKKAEAVTFEDLVKRQADGHKPPSPAEIAKALKDCGRTLDEFRQAVEASLQRRTWRAQLDRLPAVRQEVPRVRRQMEAAEAAYKQAIGQAQEEHMQTMRPLERRLQELAAEEQAGDAAQSYLQESCSDAGLLAARDDVRQRLTQAQQWSRGCWEQQQKAEFALQAAKQQLQSTPGYFAGSREQAAEQVKQAEKELAEAAKRLEAAKRDVVKLREDEAKILDKMLRS